MTKKIRRIKDNSFRGYIKRTWKNKLAATGMLLTGFASLIPGDGDATWFVMTLFIWFALFFSKHDYFQ